MKSNMPSSESRSQPRASGPAAPPEAANLRAQAEGRLADPQAGRRAEPQPDLQRLVHELEVHQAELEIQNEELQHARAQLETGLARYTEIFDFAPIGYATLVRGDVIRELNLAGAQLLGRERQLLIGSHFSAFVATQDSQLLGVLIERAARSEVKQSCELQLLVARVPRVALTEIYVRITATAVDNSTGRAVLLAFEDVTERKSQEAQLAASEQALREADRRKDEFLAMLSHELRNPLTPIHTGLYLLTHAEIPAEESKAVHHMLHRQVSHLTRLVDDLLDVTRIRSGKILLRKEHVELTELVRRVVEDHRTSFDQRGISLQLTAPAQPIYLDADPARVVQVVSNLLGNAEKFTSHGGRVKVLVSVEAGAVTVEVRDTGIGIDPHVLGRVFEPFTQAPQSLERSRGGLGLGLSMVKGLVELHGGRVAIYSRGAEKGTRVTLTLPTVAEAARADSRAASSEATQLDVCVIEDQKDAAQALQFLLCAMGHNVRVAHTGLDGIEVVKRQRPHVVFCDIGLPGLNGYAVGRELRADPSLQNTYLVALSGYGQPDDLDRTREAGFDQHITKPPEIGRLKDALAKASELSRA